MMLRRLNRPRLAAFVGVTSYLASQTAATAAGPPAPAAVVVGVSNSPGLGFAIAKRFAEGGHSVGIIGRTQERLDACKSEILAAVPGANIICISADATDAQAVKRAFSELKQAHGAPDALVYNLSCRPFPTVKVADLNVDRLENDWKTGAYGALLCIHQVLPGMREAGRGAILVTGASASLRGSASFGSFAASKSSLRALSQSLAKEVAPYGVHVAHVVVDALVDLGVGPSATAPPGRTLDTTAVAQVYHDLYSQDKRCFTFECDVRPHEAQW